MTSTTSSKKTFKQAKQFFLWSLYTGKNTMIVYLSLLTFVSLICFVFGFGISMTEPKESALIWQVVALFEEFFVESLAMIFTFVFSIKEFSYLHDKRKTDMFGSLPVSRRTIFFSKIAAIVAQSAAPMLIIMTFLSIMNHNWVSDILNMGALYNIAAGTSIEMKSLWFDMLKIFVGIIANASFIGFLSVCCGRTVDKILTYIIINGAYPVLALMLQILPGSFLVGYNTDINEFFYNALAPSSAMTSINPLYWGIFALVFGVLSFILLPKRKAECAQSHFAYTAPLIITKILISFAAGLICAYVFGLIFSMIGGDRIAFCIGMLLGSFTAYFIIQIIFAKGFKKFGKGLIPYAALMLCFAILMTILFTGMFGYESYVPSADEVESVSLVGSEEILVDGKNIIDGTITDKKQIEDCLKGHKEVIEYSKKNNSTISSLAFGSTIDSIGGTSSNMSFTYKLKNGLTVRRDYGEIYDSLKFKKTDTYKFCTSKLFLIDPSYTSDLYFYSSDVDDDDYSIIIVDGKEYPIREKYFNSKEMRVELAKALRSDIQTYGFNSGKELCEIEFTFGEDDDIHISDNTETVEVRSTYKKTIELLKKSGQTAKSGTSI